jgi:PAS domain S-box-containing protein
MPQSHRNLEDVSLREDLASYRLIFDTAAVGIGLGLPDGSMVEVNPFFCEMLGFSREELVGKLSLEIGHPDDAETTLEAIDRLRSGAADRVEYEKRYLRKDGSILWSHTTLAVVRGPAGEIRSLVATVQDISRRKLMEERLLEADRRKDEFLAMLGHELRNPLAPIRNAVHILNEKAGDDPVERRARVIIERQVAHMTRMIDDLLDVSRISRGKILLRLRRLDLVDLVRITTEDHRNELESGGLTLELDLPAAPVWVDGDPTRLSQALGNLLHNARKFTDPGGVVTVRVEEETSETAAVVLCDTGIGMEPDMVERLFETFSQADRSLDRSRGGLGLGLALVRGLVEQHGGNVKADSDGPGCGSRFTLRLPRAADPGPAAEPEPAPPLRGGRRILIIEDHRDAAESLQMLLEISGHEVQTAPDGATGLEAARRFRPDVVLCDVGLPNGMNGYDVARALRAEPDLRSCLLVALTGYGQAEDQRLAHEAGFDQHLTKPVDLVVLERVLGAAVVENDRGR